MTALKKKNRVSFTYKNELLLGTVLKGGSKKVEVLIDGTDTLLTASIHNFTLTDSPIVMTNPCDTDKILTATVKVSPIQGNEGRPVEYKLKLKGKLALTIIDDASGGELIAYSPDRKNCQKLKIFGLVADWLKHHFNIEKDFEQCIRDGKGEFAEIAAVYFANWSSDISWNAVSPVAIMKEKIDWLISVHH
jgi:hypothetical protein